MREKLFKLLFPNKYKELIKFKNLKISADVVRKKEAEIQTLRRTVRELERKRKNAFFDRKQRRG